MFYTQEESAVLGGFLSSYLNRDSASDHVRDAFARFQVGLERGCLQKSELQWAEQMLLALGCFGGVREGKNIKERLQILFGAGGE